MRGYSLTPELGGTQAALTPEGQAADAVGSLIEFWGFKRNQGRVWALLYLRGQALTASELQAQLGLSKGGVSMITRELERWGVIHRRRGPGAGPWRFEAETDFMAMIGRVIREREGQVVAHVKRDLAQALHQARSGSVAPELLRRLERLVALATLAEGAIKLFLNTAQLDITQAINILKLPQKIGRRGQKTTAQRSRS